MTVEEFKQLAPEPNGVLLLFNNLGGGNYSTNDLLIAVSSSDFISNGVTIASGSDNDQTIADATGFILDISGSNHKARIVDKIRYERGLNDHYYLKFTTINFSSTVSENLILYGSNITFTSDQLDADFVNSDYNALHNNAEKSVESNYIFKVDRKKNEIVPVNLNEINFGTAEKAETQASNYSIIGLENSKYGGAKTTKTEYGTFPAIAATEFEGAVYTTISGSVQAQDLFICSQSAEDRNIKTYYFSTNKEATSVTQGDGISDASLPRVRTTRLFFSGSKFGEGLKYSAPGSGETDFAVPTFIDIESGDVLAFGYLLGPGQTTAYENVLVNSVEFVSESVNGPIVGTSGSVQRGYLADIDSVSNLDGTTDWSNSFVFSVHKYTPDIIYEIDGSIPYRVVNKRLYLKETGEVFYVDDKGQVLAKTIDC